MIKLNFSNPTEISNGVNFDKLVVKLEKEMSLVILNIS
jgi:hypothetical protein